MHEPMIVPIPTELIDATSRLVNVGLRLAERHTDTAYGHENRPKALIHTPDQFIAYEYGHAIGVTAVKTAMELASTQGLKCALHHLTGETDGLMEEIVTMQMEEVRRNSLDEKSRLSLS